MTADFMAYGNIGAAIMCLITLSVTVNETNRNTLGWHLADTAAWLLVAHAVLLLGLSGSLARLAYAALRQAVSVSGDPSGKVAALSPPARVLQRMSTGAVLGKLGAPWWYSVIFAGVTCQAAITATTGGMNGSPFAQVLVATFILGQFRASTSRAIWGMCGVGIIFALGTHVLFLWTQHTPAEFPRFVFKARYFIAPGILVAVVSTWVYWVTYRRDEVERGQAGGTDPLDEAILSVLRDRGDVDLQTMQQALRPHEEFILNERLRRMTHEGQISQLVGEGQPRFRLGPAASSEIEQ